MSTQADWQSSLDEHQERFLDELLEFIRIPSVSALSQHEGDVVRAADWVAARLERAGIENAAVMPTGGHPVVYGDWLHAGEGKPTILIYGHFDVQPADPADLWDSPPFEPEVRDERVYGRGATDDKGSMLTPILCAEAMLGTTDRLPVNIKFFFEGQEEIGSPQLREFIARHADLLACDAVLSADGMFYAADQPMVVTGMKGLAMYELCVTTTRADLHSGLQGGITHNPIDALARVIASLHHPDGRIAVEGFYDDVIELTSAERNKIAEVPYDAEAELDALGAPAFFGEPGYSNRERNWARPTLDCNGIEGGFQGEGFKTVIPASARAKISCRLVANQEPLRIGELIREHVEQHTPPGTRAKVTVLDGGSPPCLFPASHPVNAIISDVLSQLYDAKPYHVRVGGSVPALAYFFESLGARSFNFGWSCPDENLHAPNEFFRLRNFRLGQTAYGMVLERLAEWDGKAR